MRRNLSVYRRISNEIPQGCQAARRIFCQGNGRKRGDHHSGTFIDRSPRITSYNVCYTKLLRNDAVPSGILRERERIMAMACSAVVMTFPPGVFITITPRLA